MITNFDSLNIRPEKDFLEQEKFYSHLKEENISTEEYENVKKVFNILKLETLGDLNRIYNFQDTAILCEIFESRSTLLQKPFKYNPRKCNSAKSCSWCVHRLKSKCRFVLPTIAKIIRVFEETVLVGYSCINTRMGFDSNLLLNDPKNEKILFKTTGNELKRFSSKIIKMDENNQYGMAMTKPLPYGYIKKKDNLPNFDQLEQLLNSITLDDKIGHLFTADIEFFDQNPKTLLFNEIFPPIFEKHKKIPSHMKSCSQTMSRAQKKMIKMKLLLCHSILKHMQL